MFLKRKKKGKDTKQKIEGRVSSHIPPKREKSKQVPIEFHGLGSYGDIVYGCSGNSQNPKGVWDSDIKSEYVKECGNMSKSVKIFLTSNLRWKISVLMKVFGNIEWLGYLVPVDLGGNVDNRYDFIFDDVLIPYQIVTGTKVDEIDDRNGTLSTQYVIHSHGINSVLNNFSSVDDDYINDNNDVSILFSGNDVIAEVRVKTPCGKFIRIASKDVEVKVGDSNTKPLCEWKDFVKNIKEKIKVRYEERIVRIHKISIDEFKKIKGNVKNKKNERIKKEQIENEIEKEIEEIEKEIEEFEKDLKDSNNPIPSVDNTEINDYCFRHHQYHGPDGCEWCNREKAVVNDDTKHWVSDSERISFQDSKDISDSLARIRDCLDFIEVIDIPSNIVNSIEEIQEELDGIREIVAS